MGPRALQPCRLAGIDLTAARGMGSSHGVGIRLPLKGLQKDRKEMLIGGHLEKKMILSFLNVTKKDAPFFRCS